MSTTALAKLGELKVTKYDTERLGKAVDRAVRAAFRKADEASEEYEGIAERMRNHVSNGSAESRRELAELEELGKAALVRRDEAFRSLDDYFSEQQALFRSKRLPDVRAYREAIIPTGEMLPNGVEMFRIVKRAEDASFEPADPNTECGRSVKASKSFSDRVGRIREESRGKYNDAGLLIMQSAASVDPSETVAWGKACL